MDEELADDALQELNEVLSGAGGDTEICHKMADDILCGLLKKLGYIEIVETYEKIDKWYA